MTKNFHRIFYLEILISACKQKQHFCLISKLKILEILKYLERHFFDLFQTLFYKDLLHEIYIKWHYFNLTSGRLLSTFGTRVRYF